MYKIYFSVEKYRRELTKSTMKKVYLILNTTFGIYFIEILLRRVSNTSNASKEQHSTRLFRVLGMFFHSELAACLVYINVENENYPRVRR